MSNKTKKKIGNTIFLVVLLGLTIWTVFKDQDITTIWECLKQISPLYLILGFVLVNLFVCSESVIIRYLFRTVGIHTPLINCIRYSFVGFFYSCITPSATGGQPMQIYYMQKQKIDIPTATIILMLVTIEYKFVLVFVGMALAIFGRDLIHTLTGEVQFFLYLGIGLNVFCVVLMSFLVFLPDTANFFITKGFALLKKIHLMKEKNNRSERLARSMELYKKASIFLSQNKMAIFHTTVLSFVQRFLLFSLTYLVYRALGLHGESAFTITILQAVISISVDMLPLPGGMGISERLYLLIFTPVFGSTLLTTTSLLVSRGFSYYILVIISGIISLIAHLTIREKHDTI